ncbi:MAG TPA: hypothetical protein VK909_19805 [Anaerolineales bacterium]|nr:hypothetical protein [Anaerolineales bacterium]
MFPNWKVAAPLFLVAILLVSTPYFGGVKTKEFSAYAACRKIAMATKAYATWEHEQTMPMLFRSRVRFSDGFNHLNCQAIGVGPFWTVGKVRPILASCSKDLGNGKAEPCPEDYFGVRP